MADMTDLPALMDPRTMGILSAAFAGLNASGPSLMPRSLGQIAGIAGQQGLGTYQNAWESQRKMAQTQAMVDLEKQKLLQSQAQFELQQNILKQAGLVPGGAPGSQPPSVGAPVAPGSPVGTPPPGGGVSTPSTGAPAPGGFPFNLNQIAAMKLGGMPDLTATYQAANPPGIAQRPNAPITDPRTGRIIAPPVPVPPQGMSLVQDPSVPGGWRAVGIPGAAQGAATQAGAIAKAEGTAKAETRTVEVKLADGRTIRLPESALLGQPAPQFQPGAALPPNVPESDRAAYESVASGQQKRAFGATPDPWATMPKLQTPTGMGQSTYQAGIQNKQAAAAAELSTKYGQMADDAGKRIALNNQAMDLVDKADTGPLAAQVGDVKNLLVSNFGIPENDFKNTPSATIALQKDLVNSATQKAKQQFGSRITQSEVQLMLTRGAPNVDMTKAAIKYLIGSDNALAQYQVKQAGDLGKYLSNGGDPMRFEGWYSSTFPADNATKAVHLQVGGRTPPQQAINDLKMNPKSAPQFDEIFGQGAAAKVLGR